MDCSFVAHSNERINIQIGQARTSSLHLDPTWLKLLHYEISGNGHESSITSSEFFLAPDGRTNSRSEIEANITTLLNSADNPDTEKQCKFPARINWLESQLNIPKEHQVTFEHCSDYKEWTKNDTINGISLIFASGHLSNPASFYGHVLIKFNSEQDKDDINLLDTSLNYGAVPPDNENMVVYILKGLFGGYDGSFTDQKFYRHNHTYAENELRDMWNYQLDFDKNQIEMLVDHSWELLGQDFTYYFLKQNCGYRMAELLNLVIEEPLLPPTKGWAMPSDMLNSLTELKIDNRPIVKNITIIKSRQNEFRDKYLQLERTEKSIVDEFIAAEGAYNFNSSNEANAVNLKKSIDALFDYYAFLKTKKDADIPKLEAIRRKLVLSRLNLDTEEIEWVADREYTPPHLSQNSTLIQVSPLHNSSFGTGAEFRFRAAYYDYLSLNEGRAPFSQMSMVDLRLILLDGKLSLRQFDLVNIETLNTSPTGIANDSGYAWKLNIGAKNSDLNCINCLNANINGGFGKAYSFNGTSAIYGMVTAEAVTLGPEGTQLKSGATIGLISEHNKWWKSHIEAGVLETWTTSAYTKKFVSFESRFSNARNWDARIKYTYDQASEFSLRFGYYW